MLQDELNSSEEENQALKALELPFIDLLAEQKKDEGDGNEEGNYGVEILNDGRKRRCMSTKYIDLSKIPITSNVVERFFSQVKLNMTNMQNYLLPSTMETIMFLKLNKPMVSPMTVQSALVYIHSKPQVLRSF